MKKLEHHFTWYERGKAFYFITTLPGTPRIGTLFSLDFYRPISDRYQYYIENISYRLLDGKMIVDIRLRSEFFNAYGKFKDDQEEYESMQKGAGYWWELIKKRRKERQ